MALGIQSVTISFDNNSMNAAATDWATAGNQLHPKNADVQQDSGF